MESRPFRLRRFRLGTVWSCGFASAAKPTRLPNVAIHVASVTVARARSSRQSPWPRQGGTQAHEERKSRDSFLALFAALSTIALYDVFPGSAGSFKVVIAPTSGQQKAFDPLGINLAKTFPETGSRNQRIALLPRKISFCAMKSRLAPWLASSRINREQTEKWSTTTLSTSAIPNSRSVQRIAPCNSKCAFPYGIFG